MIKSFKAECAEIVFLPSINFWSHNVQQEHLRYSNSLYPAVKQNRCNCFNIKTVDRTVGSSSSRALLYSFELPGISKPLRQHSSHRIFISGLKNMGINFKIDETLQKKLFSLLYGIKKDFGIEIFPVSQNFPSSATPL